MKNLVNVTGKSKGLGFQGVVKRWGFAGGPASHGSGFSRSNGSIGNMCSQGNVVKGKKMPGHTGDKKVSIKGLTLARLDKENSFLFLRGAVPGRKNSLVVMARQGEKL